MPDSRKSWLRPSPGSKPPVASLSPWPRCFARVDRPYQNFCGELAAWIRPTTHWFATEYFCEGHRSPTDEPILAVHVYRRVRVSLDVLLSGVHVNPPIAHVEALLRLERALEPIGAVLDVSGVRSEVVTSKPPPPPDVGFAGRRLGG